jgi:hypothetical protein
MFFSGQVSALIQPGIITISTHSISKELLLKNGHYQPDFPGEKKNFQSPDFFRL